MKQHKKLSKYLRGTAKALIALSDEIEHDRTLTKDSDELMSKIGADILFISKTYRFLDKELIP